MNENNISLKQLARKKHIYLYEVATAMGMNASAFSSLLNTELTAKQVKQIKSAIKQIYSEKKG